jgi:hypothetical protein
MTEMFISLMTNRGSKNCSKNHRSTNDNDDNSGGATPIAVRKPTSAEEGLEEVVHRPWRIPGVGGAF